MKTVKRRFRRNRKKKRQHRGKMMDEGWKIRNKESMQTGWLGRQSIRTVDESCNSPRFSVLGTGVRGKECYARLTGSSGEAFTVFI
jgi:hypothetical protein